MGKSNGVVRSSLPPPMESLSQSGGARKKFSASKDGKQRKANSLPFKMNPISSSIQTTTKKKRRSERNGEEDSEYGYGYRQDDDEETPQLDVGTLVDAVVPVLGGLGEIVVGAAEGAFDAAKKSRFAMMRDGYTGIVEEKLSPLAKEAASALKGVLTSTASKGVLTGPSTERVVPTATSKLIVHRPADQKIVAPHTSYDVISGVARERICPIPADYVFYDGVTVNEHRQIADRTHGTWCEIDVHRTSHRCKI